MLAGKNYIGNQLSAKGTNTYKTFNPTLNCENNTVFTEATPREIEEAVNLATKAFATYKKTSGKDKAAFLNTIADEILDLGETLLNMYCIESGLSKSRAISERTRTIFQLRSFAELVAEGSWVEATIDTAILDGKPTPKPDLRKILIPLGPIAVFGASNFPLAYSTAGGDTASALAAGCPVIVKSHPMHAGTGELVASTIVKAIERTGMPDGVFSNLNSSGIKVGVQLVQNSTIKAVGFTGSIQGGRALFNLASQRKEPIPVFAEMGSVNPVVLLPKALKKRSVQLATELASSITLGTGQFCTNPGLLLGIKSDELTTLIKQLSDEIVEIEPTCMLHPNIIGAYKRKRQQAVSQKGLTIVTEKTINPIQANFARQTVVTVDGHTFLENTSLHQEVFGPFSIVVQCKDAKQLERIISNLEGQLTGTIIIDKDEESKYSTIIDALQNRVGRLIYNGVPTGVEVCPSMQHGGPYPASTDSRFTAVGIHSIKRWVRPFSFQDCPDNLLPYELKKDNPLKITRLVNGSLKK